MEADPPSLGGPVVAVRQTVLVVDDDLDIRDALQDVFEFAGYEVVVAADGHEALQRLRNGARPHLILLDLMMPRMSGFEFREEQQREEALANIPVLVASADLRLAEAAGALGVAGWLRKPLDVPELLSTVQRLCLPT